MRLLRFSLTQRNKPATPILTDKPAEAASFVRQSDGGLQIEADNQTHTLRHVIYLSKDEVDRMKRVLGVTHTTLL